MTEPLLATTARLTAATEALAALAAHLRVTNEGLVVDPRIASLLGQVAAELTGSADVTDDAAPAAIGMARAMLRESVALIEDPGRTGGWSNQDPVVLQGMGRLSMAIAPVLARAAALLPGLADALDRPGARFLDVGTGTGWLAIATARTFPRAEVTGIDIFEPALALARQNVAAEDMAARVPLHHRDVTELDGSDPFDAIWLPLPFLPRDIVAGAIEHAAAALRPGAWLLPGTFAGPDDALSRLLVDLRIVRSGGHPWSVADMTSMLTAAGLDHAHEIERTWPAPVRLFAARRPE
jgi:SAM-dependent methyltransferase